MVKTYLMSLEEIQPSQLYINAAKLAHVQNHFDPTDPSSYNAVPVKRFDGELIYTDGHTRAYNAHLEGLDKVKAYWENEELNWEMYRVCVEWCKDEGIETIKDLENRVIPPAKFEKLWTERCHDHEAYE